MDQRQAISAFGALAQDTRLAIVRMLVKAGPLGMAAGSIADSAGVAASNVSFHLKDLEHAGLVSSRREARSIIYSANFETLRGLIAFLMKDCCSGHPEICDPLLASACCTPASKRLGEKNAREAHMTDRVYNVLFLCTGNSARSILAESILRKDGQERFRAFSAGSTPNGHVNPLAVQTLENFGYPTDGLRSKTWLEFAQPDAPVMDFVFTVCDNAAGEACPVWPGHPATAHWGIEDPAKSTEPEFARRTAFVVAFGFMKKRIDAFMSLPLASIDKLSLKTKLNDIGQFEGSTSRQNDVA